MFYFLLRSSQSLSRWHGLQVLRAIALCKEFIYRFLFISLHINFPFISFHSVQIHFMSFRFPSKFLSFPFPLISFQISFGFLSFPFDFLSKFLSFASCRFDFLSKFLLFAFMSFRFPFKNSFCFLSVLFQIPFMSFHFLSISFHFLSNKSRVHLRRGLASAHLDII